MKAVDTNLLKLLRKSSQFLVPIYQRRYSWGEAECGQLWRDIVRAGSSDDVGAHFTGSIVYVATDESTHTSTEPDLIIDGQQRVTTVTLILAAIARHLGAKPDGEREPIEGFTPNKIRNRYLVDPDEEGERSFKLLLSQEDREPLKQIMSGSEPEAYSSSPVADNFRLLLEKVNDPKTDLAAVCRGLDKLVVVDVSLTRGVDNPQLVFEAMNSTGKRLSQADLIRNYVLMDMEPGAQEKLYTGRWRPMEVEFAGAPEAKFDEFVRHYLTIKRGTIPRLDDIYEVFKDQAADVRSKGQSREELVVELRDYARRFGRVALGKEPDDVLRRAFRGLDQVKADIVYPFLLEAYSDYETGVLDHDELLEVTEMVTSYVFRRAVCRIPTNSLNKTFTTFMGFVHKDRYVDSVKAHFLGLTTYRRFPTDAEFLEALQAADLYNFRRRSYFFRVIENHGRKEQVSIEDYSIEHIMPQNTDLSRAWREVLGPDWVDVQERRLHTLGNLTLTGYNSEYSDRPFVEKRDMVGGFADSPLRLNKGLGALESWNEDAMIERGRRLAQQAVQIWKRPELDEKTLTEFAEESKPARYTIEDHPELLASPVRELFEQLSDAVLKLDPGITREFRQQCVAFRAEANFVYVIPQRGRLKLHLSIPVETLTDERRLAVAVGSKDGRVGGPVGVILDDDSDFAYIMGLVRQAYEYQMDEG